jgi:hypothetical protein
VLPGERNKTSRRLIQSSIINAHLKLENLVLVTFDSEMIMAAQRRGLALFTQ